MSGDYSRKRFDKQKQYSSVELQQGRVLLDSDWNEQSEIIRNRIQTETLDTIGRSGIPKSDNGFEISIAPDGSDIYIAPGKVYVEGLLCELENGATPTSYLNQPFYPVPDRRFFTKTTPPVIVPPIGSSFIDLKDGTYILYLDVWEKEINAIDDPLIKEVALGDADTTTRLQVVWQARLMQIPPFGGEIVCDNEIAEWTQLTTPSKGKLNARTVASTSADKPCLSDPVSGYRRLENQLYRVEIHQAGDKSKATFKWSRDNASVQSKILEVDSSIITVESLGKDDVLGFAPGNWVEIIDEEVALNCATKAMFQIDSISPETNEITLKTSAASFAGKDNLKLCRWDQKGVKATEEGISMGAGWVKIEDGLEINFSDGDYKDGDYWLIPARTATGEIEWPPYKIPNTNPIAQTSHGIQHRYCKLATLVVNQGIGTLYDCRKKFPALTKLEAEDIAYDNSNCPSNNSNTVQEALDALCAVTDLREHNKHVHGYGVVCGLKVVCGPTRSEVVVEKGYAHDCEGNVIQVSKKNEIPFDIVSAAAAQGLIDPFGDGELSLAINSCSANGPDLYIEKFVKKSFWDEVLEGSLIKDVYDGCVQNLINFAKKNFTFNLSTQAPLDISQKRLTTLVNLALQYVNQQTLPYAFLSGTEVKDRNAIDCKDEKAIGRYEDQILWCMYKELRNILDSETHCGMFDGDTLFPNYEIDPGLHTIFGPAFKAHHNIQLHPGNKFAYTCGFDNCIFVYDLKTQEYIQAAKFPSSSNGVVKDFVIENDGKTIYALCILNDKDTLFAEGSINADGTITWGKTSVRCGEVYHTLAINSTNKIYCIQKNKGLYDIKAIGGANFTITQINAFNATGMLILSEDDKYAFAADFQTNNTTESAKFTHISQFDLGNAANPVHSYEFEGDDLTNDIALFDNNLYITGYKKGAPGQRVMGGYNINSKAAIDSVDLPTDWLVKIAPIETKESGKCMLVTQCDSAKVFRVFLGNNPTIDTNFRIPTQLFPMDIVVDKKGRKAYVLNFLVNTITDIDIAASFDVVNIPDYTFEPPVIISDYRDGVIEAYKDLLSHFWQYLKDCFADKFLIDCPDCKDNDRVYLASVEIRDKKVYHINNFSKRKYVKSPELWEYWLSTVPILPMFKEKFKEFCGMVL